MRSSPTIAMARIGLLCAVLPSPAFAQSEAECDPAPGYHEVALLGEQRDASAGGGVVSLGDINGDGRADFAINAGQYAYQGVPFRGLTYVLYGTPHQEPISLGLIGPDAAPDSTLGFVIGRGGSNLANGGKIQGLGDVDGDGVDDFIIGLNNAGGPQGTFRGGVYLFYGRRAESGAAAFPLDIDLAAVESGAYGDQVRVHFGPIPLPTDSFYGQTVQALGDINGDGHADFSVGMRGRVFVYHGQADRSLPIEPVVTLRMTADFGTLGFGQGGGFDYDGDGVNDLLVCETNADPQALGTGGICYLLWGASLPLLGPEFVVDQLLPHNGGDGSLGLVFRGGESNASLGRESRFLGTLDLNGDGRTDLVFGSPGTTIPTPGTPDLQSGRVYVVYGSSDLKFVELSLASLALANPGVDQLGFVLEGAPVLQGRFGERLASAGDANGDGVDDLLVGALGDASCSSLCGSVWVIKGRRAPQSFPPLTRVTEASLAGGLGYRFGPGPSSSQRFGGALTSLPDFSGDGKPEWLVGAQTARIGDGLRGKACLYLSSLPVVIQPPPLLVNTGWLWTWLGMGLLLVSAGVWRLRTVAPGHAL